MSTLKKLIILMLLRLAIIKLLLVVQEAPLTLIRLLVHQLVLFFNGMVLILFKIEIVVVVFEKVNPW